MSNSKSRTIYVSAEDWERLEKLLKDTKDYCNDLKIDTVAKLMHVLANLGRREFLRRVETARKPPSQK